MRRNIKFLNPETASPGSIIQLDASSIPIWGLGSQAENVLLVSPSYTNVYPQYSTIQAAIDAASLGDLVIVNVGLYSEDIVLKNGVDIYFKEIYQTVLIGDISDGGVDVDVSLRIRVTASTITTIELLGVSSVVSIYDSFIMNTSVSVGATGIKINNDGLSISDSTIEVSLAGGFAISADTAKIAAIDNVIINKSMNNITNSVHADDKILPEASEIGHPVDGDYTDGFFDTWTNETKKADAFDEISEAFLDLAPPKAPMLTGSDLTKNFPDIFSGHLSAGLAVEWYIDFVAGDEVTQLAENTNVELDTIAFRAGKKDDYVDGYVTAESKIGVAASWTGEGSRNVRNDGVGSTGAIEILRIETYNIFWADMDARLNFTLIATGSNKFRIITDFAGNANELQLFYVDNNPVQSFSTPPSAVENTVVDKYLSGIAYYGVGSTFDISYVANNLFEPVYLSNHCQITGTYFDNEYDNKAGIPNHSDVHSSLKTMSVIADRSSGQAVGLGYVYLYKPNKSSFNNSYNIGSKAICSYGIHSSDVIEYLHDEDKRRVDETTPGWTPANPLTDGNLEVQNGRLIHGNHGNYSGFAANNQQYCRAFTPVNGNTAGSLVIDINGFTGVSVWDSVGKLEISFIIPSDAGAYRYDFGRFVGDNLGIIYGVKLNETVAGGQITINWTIPDPPGTGVSSSDPMILVVKFNDTLSTEYIEKVEVTFVEG